VRLTILKSRLIAYRLINAMIPIVKSASDQTKSKEANEPKTIIYRKDIKETVFLLFYFSFVHKIFLKINEYIAAIKGFH